MQSTTIELEGQTFPIVIKRHGRAKRYTIRYDAVSQTIKLTVPNRASIRQGLAFTKSRANWIFQQMHRSADRVKLEAGEEFPLFGLNTLLAHQPGRGLAELDESEQPQTLIVYGDAAFFASRLDRFLKQYLKEFIQPLARNYAGQLNVKYKRIAIRDTRSHWGSCSPDGNLSFAYRLVFADPMLIDYIVAHEVAHLKEMNHSSAFWALVAQLCPNYKMHRKWLKEHGNELSRFYV